MLSDGSDDTSNGNDDSRNALIGGLVDGLRTRGIDVTVFTFNGEQPANRSDAGVSGRHEGIPEIPDEIRKSVFVSTVFERGEHYDIIHNHLGFLPLTYMGMTTTPVLTPLYEGLSPAEVSIYKYYNPKTFYAAGCDACRYPDLDFIAGIRHDPEFLVEDYIRAYRKVMEKRHREDHRPWGFYEILSDAPDHKVKRITVYPAQRLSYQRHFRRSEHWYAVKGAAIATRNGKDIELTAGQAIDIPVRTWHRIRNPGPAEMVFIEVQTGDYFEEDDIERAEDDYGRA